MLPDTLAGRSYLSRSVRRREEKERESKKLVLKTVVAASMAFTLLAPERKRERETATQKQQQKFNERERVKGRERSSLYHKHTAIKAAKRTLHTLSLLSLSLFSFLSLSLSRAPTHNPETVFMCPCPWSGHAWTNYKIHYFLSSIPLILPLCVSFCVSLTFSYSPHD